MSDHQKCIHFAVDFSDSLYSWVLNQTLYVKAMCTSGHFTISFFLVTQNAIWVCLLLVVTSISLFELIWTLEQCNRDLMWKQFISTVVNLCLFTLYLNIDEHTLHFPCFHKQYLQSCDRELSLLVFVPPRWGNGKRWSDFPDSPLRFNDRTKTRTSSWALGSLSFPPPLASSNTDSSVNIPPESV